jgi:hypothetical protein
LYLTGTDRDLSSEEDEDHMNEITHKNEGLEDKPPTPIEVGVRISYRKSEEINEKPHLHPKMRGEAVVRGLNLRLIGREVYLNQFAIFPSKNYWHIAYSSFFLIAFNHWLMSGWSPKIQVSIFDQY